MTLVKTMDTLEIKAWLKHRNIKKYIIQPDLSVDVFQGLIFQEEGNFPIKFGRTTHYFNCGNSKLTTLKGCPDWVEGGFYCKGNQLTSLMYSPKLVKGDFVCLDNPIKDLIGFDCEFTGHFYHIGTPICGLEHLYHPLKIDVQHGINAQYADYPLPQYQIYVEYDQIKEIIFYENLQHTLHNKEKITKGVKI